MSSNQLLCLKTNLTNIRCFFPNRAGCDRKSQSLLISNKPVVRSSSCTMTAINPAGQNPLREPCSQHQQHSKGHTEQENQRLRSLRTISLKRQTKGHSEREREREQEGERSLELLETVQVILMYEERPEGLLCGPWQQQFPRICRWVLIHSLSVSMCNALKNHIVFSSFQGCVAEQFQIRRPLHS